MKQLFTILLGVLIYQTSNSQGCVAIRSNGSTCSMSSYHVDPNQKTSNDSWTFAVNSRYFRSYKHFVGTIEQKQRVEDGTEVINHVFSTEFSITRQFNDRWSFGLFVPVADNSRSSLYEHDNKHRYSTYSFGLGDVRFAAYYWLMDPAKASKFNVQLGAGLKLPTSNYNYLDYFHKNDSTKILGPVDQSIQLGDGGTGITFEVNSFYSFSKNVSVYFNGFYLSNPREVNGVSTARGSAVSASAVANGSDVMSVPDQYMTRLGADYLTSHFTFSGGVRMECVPVHDLIGGSNGFRRPGFVISAEPVIAYKTNSGTHLYISIPYAIVRNRTQSVPDIIKTNLSGVYAQGDAAFADYTINIGVSFSLK